MELISFFMMFDLTEVGQVASFIYVTWELHWLWLQEETLVLVLKCEAFIKTKVAVVKAH